MPFLKIHYPVSEELLEDQRKLAGESPRRRSMFVICGGPAHPVQALVNTFMQDSYAQPHKHAIDEEFEGVAGSFRIVIFSDDGAPKKIFTLPQGGLFRVPAGRWHTVLCVSENGTIFETKECRYNEATDKIFADWAPKEGTPEAVAYLDRLRNHG